MGLLAYLELPVSDLAVTQRFYGEAFDADFELFGSSYSSTMTGSGDIGLQADSSEMTASLLPVLSVPDVDMAQVAVEAAGGQITRAVFAFPGGRRFHFKDPAGHELAAMQHD